MIPWSAAFQRPSNGTDSGSTWAPPVFYEGRTDRGLVKDLMGDELIVVPRRTKIFIRGKYFNYPLEPLNAVFGMGLFTTLRILANYGWSGSKGCQKARAPYPSKTGWSPISDARCSISTSRNTARRFGASHAAGSAPNGSPSASEGCRCPKQLQCFFQNQRPGHPVARRSVPVSPNGDRPNLRKAEQGIQQTGSVSLNPRWYASSAPGSRYRASRSKTKRAFAPSAEVNSSRASRSRN